MKMIYEQTLTISDVKKDNNLSNYYDKRCRKIEKYPKIIVNRFFLFVLCVINNDNLSGMNDLSMIQ